MVGFLDGSGTLFNRKKMTRSEKGKICVMSDWCNLMQNWRKVEEIGTESEKGKKVQRKAEAKER